VDDRRAKSYHRTTVYLTDEQRQWLNRIAAQARLDGVSLSGADVVRLAIVRLQQQLSEDELRQALIDHVRTEAVEYPGRVKRGLPGA
jgi:DNA polymerase I-like protein with 3'-5' exonuclease and polymerase domains